MKVSENHFFKVAFDSIPCAVGVAESRSQPKTVVFYSLKLGWIMKREHVDRDLLEEKSFKRDWQVREHSPAPKHNRSTPIMPTDILTSESSDSQESDPHYNKTGTFPQAKFVWYAEWFLGNETDLAAAANSDDPRAAAVLMAADYFKNAIDQYQEDQREGEEPDYGN